MSRAYFIPLQHLWNEDHSKVATDYQQMYNVLEQRKRATLNWTPGKPHCDQTSGSSVDVRVLRFSPN
jgi:hypothetical protein